MSESTEAYREGPDLEQKAPQIDPRLVAKMMLNRLLNHRINVEPFEYLAANGIRSRDNGACRALVESLKIRRTFEVINRDFVEQYDELLSQSRAVLDFIASLDARKGQRFLQEALAALGELKELARLMFFDSEFNATIEIQASRLAVLFQLQNNPVIRSDG